MNQSLPWISRKSSVSVLVMSRGSGLTSGSARSLISKSQNRGEAMPRNRTFPGMSVVCVETGATPGAATAVGDTSNADQGSSPSSSGTASSTTPVPSGASACTCSRYSSRSGAQAAGSWLATRSPQTDCTQVTSDLKTAVTPVTSPGATNEGTVPLLATE